MDYHLLVIDDDPLVAEHIRTVVPDWTVLAAANGVDGMAVVREWSTRLDLVVLDIAMPHAGTLTAVQIRTEVPSVPILVYTNGATTTEVQTLTALGCPPPVSKDISAAHLRSRIQATAQQLVAPLPANALLPFLLATAHDSEQHLLQQRPPVVPVALVSAMGVVRTTIQTAIAQAGHEVRIMTGDLPSLHAQLGHRHVDLLVADSSMLTMAQTVAETHQLPLLIIARSMSSACQIEQAHMVVLDVLTPTVMHDAITVLLSGHPYVSPEVHQMWEQSGLTEMEQGIAQCYLRNMEVKQIALQLNIARDTVYHRWNGICTKLGIQNTLTLAQWVDRWYERRQP